MNKTIRRTLLALLIVVSSWTHAAEGDIGIVLLHGKWDRPPTHVMLLARQLENAGYKVVTPLMPWSDPRSYDASYPQALIEIEASAKSLRDQGVKRIIVAGQSFGANGALAYAASGRPIAGVVALSPGHTPERGAFRKAVESSVAKAQAMFSSGNGAEKAWFEDRNQGRSKNIRASAEVYLSYFDPEGAGNMQKSAALIPSPTPLFMAVGTADAMASLAKESIFLRAPMHERSRYLSVAADHMSLLTVIGPDLIAWLQTLD